MEWDVSRESTASVERDVSREWTASVEWDVSVEWTASMEWDVAQGSRIYRIVLDLNGQGSRQNQLVHLHIDKLLAAH